MRLAQLAIEGRRPILRQGRISLIYESDVKESLADLSPWRNLWE
jgi:hypothetical protein